MIGMAISDIVQCLLGYPLEIYSSQHGHWKFDMHSCVVILCFTSLAFLNCFLIKIYLYCIPYYREFLDLFLLCH